MRGRLRGSGRDLFCGGEARGRCVRWLRHRLCCQSRVLHRGLRGDVPCGGRASPVLCSSRGKCLRQLGMLSLRGLPLEVRKVVLRGPVLCWSRLGRDVPCGGHARGRCVRWLRHRLCCQSRVLLCELGGDVTCGGRLSRALCSSRGKRLLQGRRKSMRPSESIRKVLGVVSSDMSVQHMSLHSEADAHVPMASEQGPECLPGF